MSDKTPLSSTDLVNHIQGLACHQVTLGQLAAVKNIEISSDNVKLTLEFACPLACLDVKQITHDINALCLRLVEKPAQCEMHTRILRHQTQMDKSGPAQIKNIIAVASGKGGVGKSTVALNLAIALSRMGTEVGLLDADIYGPSQPELLGLGLRPEIRQNQKISPIRAQGLQTMSIGYLIDAEAPTIWRGPMVSRALQQLLEETDWQNLDYLVVDLPPGTGDIQLTLAQKIPVAASVIVTTPHPLACLDAKKAVRMFEKVSIPILGVVENMSFYECAACQHPAHLFGNGGGLKLAQALGLPLLAQIPIDSSLMATDDRAALDWADSSHQQYYRALAEALALRLGVRPRETRSAVPFILT